MENNKRKTFKQFLSDNQNFWEDVGLSLFEDSEEDFVSFRYLRNNYYDITAIDEKFDAVDVNIDDIETAISSIDTTLASIDTTLTSIDNTLTQLETTLEDVESTFSNYYTKEEVDEKISQVGGTNIYIHNIYITTSDLQFSFSFITTGSTEYTISTLRSKLLETPNLIPRGTGYRRDADGNRSLLLFVSSSSSLLSYAISYLTADAPSTVASYYLSPADVVTFTDTVELLNG